MVELRALDITLARLPNTGHYRVNFIYGADATAATAEKLDDAIKLGRAMAVERAERQAEEAKFRRALANLAARGVTLARLPGVISATAQTRPPRPPRHWTTPLSSAERWRPNAPQK